MKRTRLFILICAMLISLALVGCSTSKNISKTETEAKVETETKVEPQRIKSSIAVKHTEKEIVVFSDTTCFFDLEVYILDDESISTNTYHELQISEGETITFTLDDLAHGFFSDKAIIQSVSPRTRYIYGDSPLVEENYKNIDCSLMIKYSSKEVIIYSDTACFFDLNLGVDDAEFNTTIDYMRLNISEKETITLTIDDLAAGFCSDTAIIDYCNTHIQPYVER